MNNRFFSCFHFLFALVAGFLLASCSGGGGGGGASSASPLSVAAFQAIIPNSTGISLTWTNPSLSNPDEGIYKLEIAYEAVSVLPTESDIRFWIRANHPGLSAAELDEAVATARNRTLTGGINVSKSVILDKDGDGILYRKDGPQSDNCLHISNRDQRDRDGDGVGDDCDLNDSSLVIIPADRQVQILWPNPVQPTSGRPLSLDAVDYYNLTISRDDGETEQVIFTDPETRLARSAYMVANLTNDHSYTFSLAIHYRDTLIPLNASYSPTNASYRTTVGIYPGANYDHDQLADRQDPDKDNDGIANGQEAAGLELRSALQDTVLLEYNGSDPAALETFYAAGKEVSYRLDGLEPNSYYTFAVRAYVATYVNGAAAQRRGFAGTTLIKGAVRDKPDRPRSAIRENMPVFIGENLDGDSLADALDPDDDGDTVTDAGEYLVNATGDTVDCSRTTDCDRDGVNDKEERGIHFTKGGITYACATIADCDRDGTADSDDAIDDDPAETRDSDQDRIGDNKDNCPFTANPNQLDSERDAQGQTVGDGRGDVCEGLANRYRGANNRFDLRAIPSDTVTRFRWRNLYKDETDRFPPDVNVSRIVFRLTNATLAQEFLVADEDTHSERLSKNQTVAFSFNITRTHTNLQGEDFPPSVGEEGFINITFLLTYSDNTSESYPIYHIEDFAFGANYDRDEYADRQDGDDDNDGVLDKDETASYRGTQCRFALDCDGDGTNDLEDAIDDDPNETEDSDGDGVGDNADPDKNDPTERKDTDQDGIADSKDPCVQWNPSQDAQSAVKCDPNRKIALFPYEDSILISWKNSRQLASLIIRYRESVDIFSRPLRPNELTYGGVEPDRYGHYRLTGLTPDTRYFVTVNLSYADEQNEILGNLQTFNTTTGPNPDNDYWANAADDNDDNDGFADSREGIYRSGDEERQCRLLRDCDGDEVIDGTAADEDSFPLDPTEWKDSDGDGTGDNADYYPLNPHLQIDRDFDQVEDDEDNCLLAYNRNQANEDGDSQGDSCDSNAKDSAAAQVAIIAATTLKDNRTFSIATVNWRNPTEIYAPNSARIIGGANLTRLRLFIDDTEITIADTVAWQFFRHRDGASLNVSKSPASTTLVPAETNQYRISGLRNGTNYRFRITASYHSVTILLTEQTIRTPSHPFAAPVDPAAITVAAGRDTMQVSWQALGNEDDVLTRIAYVITATGETAAETSRIIFPVITDSGPLSVRFTANATANGQHDQRGHITRGQLYNLSVQARYEGNIDSPPSHAGELSAVYPLPPAVEDFTVSFPVSPNPVTITWNPPVAPSVSPAFSEKFPAVSTVTGYQVTSDGPALTSSFPADCSAPPCSQTIGISQPGQLYSFSIATRYSELGTASSASKRGGVYPAQGQPVSNVIALSGRRAVYVVWQPPVSPFNTAADFQSLLNYGLAGESTVKVTQGDTVIRSYEFSGSRIPGRAPEALVSRLPPGYDAANALYATIHPSADFNTAQFYNVSVSALYAGRDSSASQDRRFKPAAAEVAAAAPFAFYPKPRAPSNIALSRSSLESDQAMRVIWNNPAVTNFTKIGENIAGYSARICQDQANLMGASELGCITKSHQIPTQTHILFSQADGLELDREYFANVTVHYTTGQRASAASLSAGVLYQTLYPVAENMHIRNGSDFIEVRWRNPVQRDVDGPNRRILQIFIEVTCASRLPEHQGCSSNVYRKLLKGGPFNEYEQENVFRIQPNDDSANNPFRFVQDGYIQDISLTISYGASNSTVTSLTGFYLSEAPAPSQVQAIGGASSFSVNWVNPSPDNLSEEVQAKANRVPLGNITAYRYRITNSTQALTHVLLDKTVSIRPGDPLPTSYESGDAFSAEELAGLTPFTLYNASVSVSYSSGVESVSGPDSQDEFLLLSFDPAFATLFDRAAARINATTITTDSGLTDLTVRWNPVDLAGLLDGTGFEQYRDNIEYRVRVRACRLPALAPCVIQETASNSRSLIFDEEDGIIPGQVYDISLQADYGHIEGEPFVRSSQPGEDFGAIFTNLTVDEFYAEPGIRQLTFRWGRARLNATSPAFDQLFEYSGNYDVSSANLGGVPTIIANDLSHSNLSAVFNDRDLRVPSPRLYQFNLRVDGMLINRENNETVTMGRRFTTRAGMYGNRELLPKMNRLDINITGGFNVTAQWQPPPNFNFGSHDFQEWVRPHFQNLEREYEVTLAPAADPETTSVFRVSDRYISTLSHPAFRSSMAADEFYWVNITVVYVAFDAKTGDPPPGYQTLIYSLPPEPITSMRDPVSQPGSIRLEWENPANFSQGNSRSLPNFAIGYLFFVCPERATSATDEGCLPPHYAAAAEIGDSAGLLLSYNLPYRADYQFDTPYKIAIQPSFEWSAQPAQTEEGGLGALSAAQTNGIISQLSTNTARFIRPPPATLALSLQGRTSESSVSPTVPISAIFHTITQAAFSLDAIAECVSFVVTFSCNESDWTLRQFPDRASIAAGGGNQLGTGIAFPSLAGQDSLRIPALNTSLDALGSYYYALCNATDCPATLEVQVSDDQDGDSIADGADIDIDNDGLIEIASAYQLDQVRFALDGSGRRQERNGELNTLGCPAGGCNGYELATNIDLSTYESVESGTIEGSGWIPLAPSLTFFAFSTCDFSTPFTGIFEGNGFAITGLNIESNHYCLSLFGSVRRATIRNLIVIANRIEGARLIGTLASDVISNSIIMNVTSIAQVIDATGIGNSGGYSGGLVGRAAGSGRIIASSARTQTINGIRRVGGLLGHDAGGTVIRHSSAATGTIRGGNYLGGLVGSGRTTIEYSNATTGEIVSVTSGSNLGGLVGDGQRATISYSNATTREIRGSSTSSNQLGGLVGDGESATIRHSKVTTGTITGRDFLGGLAGHGQSATIQHSSATTGTISGSSRLGGLAGSGFLATIRHSKATTGTIAGTAGSIGGLSGDGGATIIEHSSATTETITGNDVEVGGLVGDCSDATIQHSKATTGTISSGSSYTGGLGGDCDDATIQHSKATTGEIRGTSFVGGLVGEGPGTIIEYSSATTGTIRSQRSGQQSIGGLVGQDAARILHSNALTGIIYSTGEETGGLIGTTSSTVVRNASAITGEIRGGNSNIGGLIGQSAATSIMASSSFIGKIKPTFVEGGVARRLGGLVGSAANTDILASLAVTHTLASNGGKTIGGLVGGTLGNLDIVASYVILDRVIDRDRDDSFTNITDVGGLISSATTEGNSISYSYAATANLSHIDRAGGLVGAAASGVAVADSYWDINTSALSASGGGSGQTTQSLQQLTDYGGIYANWSNGADISGDSGIEATTRWCDTNGNGEIDSAEQTDDNRIWDFGMANQYPAIHCLSLGLNAQRNAYRLDDNQLAVSFDISEPNLADCAAASTTNCALDTDGFTIGNLHLVGDSDYYEINIPATGNLTVHSKGDGLDTAGFLYNTTLHQQISDENSGAGEHFAFTHYIAQPGVYYINIQSGANAATAEHPTGTYILFTSFSPD